MDNILIDNYLLVQGILFSLSTCAAIIAIVYLNKASSNIDNAIKNLRNG